MCFIVNSVLKDDDKNDQNIDDAGFVDNDFDDLNSILNGESSNGLPLVAHHDPMLPVLRDQDDDGDSLFDELERMLISDGEIDHSLVSYSILN